jgi:hypothetical protein
MLLLFILFIFSAYGISSQAKSESFEKIQKVTFDAGYEVIENKEILVVTDNDEVLSHLEQELSYMKKGYLVKDSLFSVTKDEGRNLRIIILASETMKNSYDLSTVKSYLNKGVNIIFAILPVQEIDDDWKSLLGIDEINDKVRQDGIITFKGFFLGGKQDYENLVVDAPYTKVASTCKTYIVGYKEKKSDYNVKEYEFMYDIVWRNIYQGSQIYVINGYSINQFGVGILSAIFAQIYPDYLYPVINAKTLIINNAPYFSNENNDEMMSRYSRKAVRFFNDLVLPNIISINLTYNCVPTLYGISGFDKNVAEGDDYDTAILPLLQNSMSRMGGEIGISAYDLQHSAPKQKVLDDIQLYEKHLGEFSLRSLNVSNYDQSARAYLIDEVEKRMPLYSVVSFWDDGATFSYYNDNIVNVPIISRGFEYTEDEYIKLQGMATALGVISHEVDMADIIFPKGSNDDWTNAVKDLSSFVDSYWKPYKTFSSMNITQMSLRVARFINMSPDITVKDNVIKVNINNFNTEAYFVLRTGKEIMKITNGSYNIIEDGSYLIIAKDASLTIELE